MDGRKLPRARWEITLWALGAWALFDYFLGTRETGLLVLGAASIAGGFLWLWRCRKAGRKDDGGDEEA